MELTDEDKEYYLQQTKTISFRILLCTLIFFVGLFIIVCVGLLFRFLRLKFGSKVKPSTNKVIVITGATSGLGLALAKHFHRKGFTVVATYYNIKEPGYDELQAIIKNQGLNKQSNHDEPRLFLVHMDVRSERSIDTSADEIEGLIRKFQLELFSVVCNAGVCLDCFFELNMRESISKTIQTNLLGTVMVAKRFTRPIIESKGRIVVVSSICYNLITPSVPIYSATKAAIKSFADCLNEDLKRYGASCRCVCPGNLLNQSSIALSAANNFLESLAMLGPEERDIYKQAIEEASRILSKQLKLRANQLKEDPKHTAEAYIVDLTEEKMNYDFKLTPMIAIRDWLASFVDGSNSCMQKKTDANEMEALTAFDYAVCSKDPPRRCYCGNKFFQYITGPLIWEYMPQILMPAFYSFFENRLRGKV